MLRLILGRILFMIPAVLIVATITFAMFHLVPGDPVIIMAGEQASPEAIAAIRVAYGFDQPIIVQYFKYLLKLIQGDLGQSIYNRIPVRDLIIPAFLNTLSLVGLSMLVGVMISLTVGPLAAMYYRSFLDKFLSVISLVGISTPIFILGIAALYFFSVKLHMFPVSGLRSWKGYVLPVMTLGIYQASHLTRMARSIVANALGQDYIQSARAKGISEFKVVYKHALKNAMLPLTTIIGLRLGYQLAGAIVAEVVFTWPGLGRLLIVSIGNRDLPVTQGSLILAVLVFVTINLVVDIAYSFLDPTIKYE